MKNVSRIKRLRWWLLGGFLLASYPTVVLAYTWSHVLSSDLPGGRHGPLDAYRHTLASAFVGCTLGSQAVELVTQVMESSSKRSSIMDRHNNRLGARIGAACDSISNIEPKVAASIAQGQINATHPNQSTWLPPEDWRQGKLW
ncbi:hypothetical protein [Variovorax sp. PCZ-1]|uniref:hypothetical protein n=1 Tax=Variovorax sp. PCZ-1 TaxID=2835533 RepID=UPI001BD17304|nr:hypothetical protein [Variovorax sp. PCZ-1]MBS7806497.1 hypothetical protein [Variovorax sp. PCZ-1]